MAVPGKDQTETDTSTIICASCTCFVHYMHFPFWSAYYKTKTWITRQAQVRQLWSKLCPFITMHEFKKKCNFLTPFALSTI